MAAATRTGSACGDAGQPFPVRGAVPRFGLGTERDRYVPEFAGELRTDALATASALAITETALGPDHPTTAIRLNNLALTYRALGRPADALPLEERALPITETTLGPNHPTTAIRLGNLAGTYRALGRPADALPLEERAEQIRQRLR
jgi:tetratricopeptide (TPR) repeat protein